MSRRSLGLQRIVALLLGPALVAPATSAIAGRELGDPTRPSDVSYNEEHDDKRGSSLPYVLSAILVAKGRRIAVINGQPLQTGDRVAGATVKSILRDKVVLRTKDQDVTLRLVTANIKHHKESQP
ncbi:MAG: general secretion pathway protein GspB [bacterium]|nr:general secretion pathway protein GspB [bacterium]